MHMCRGWSLMRLLDIDKRTFWYANYVGRSMLMDGDYVTGERSTEYTDPVEAKGTISDPSGAATAREFGTYVNYNYVIHMEGQSCPFDENSVIWLNRPTTEAPDYKVMRISVNRTHVAVAIREMR